MAKWQSVATGELGAAAILLPKPAGTLAAKNRLVISNFALALTRWRCHT